ncbi:MAG TPA: hypothetical protein PKC39_09590 [Ferruginibacter sp.]|nr:hypothetical protein [Ferruginibacter sp.]HMP21199.1 hypothetical protein [Ferruginibacter sp.]
MNTKLLLLIVAAVAFSSCSSVYKTGQTPDDVYYSPVRTNYYVDTDQQRREEAMRTATLEDRQIRMGINNRRWRSFDDDFFYSYNYNPYRYGFNSGFYYNPFYCTLPVYYPISFIPATPRNTTPRMVNLAGYGNGYNNVNTAIKPKTGTYSSRPGYNNSNSGGILSRILSPGSNNSNSSSGNSNRTYSPSSSSGKSSSSSGGGSISRPARRN